MFGPDPGHALYAPCPAGPSGLRRNTPAGCVVYNGSKIDIPPEAVDQKFIEAFEYFLGVIAGLEPAWKVPSCHECCFCDIARTECPERIED